MHRRAFTLVELLIVITIIAVLIALLLPALGKAQYEARQVRCMSQLKMQGVGHSIYQADNREFFPQFGGSPVWSGAGVSLTYSTQVPHQFQFYDINNNAGTYTYFRQYLNAGTNATRASLAVNYCPMLDWINWGPQFFTSDNPTFFRSGLPGAYSGYMFYTGRKYYFPGGSMAGDLDTIMRHRDNREILVTDVLVLDWQAPAVVADGYGGTLRIGTDAPWFNPHVGRSATNLQQGDFNQLDASFAVKRYNFVDCKFGPNTSGTVYSGTVNGQWFYGRYISTADQVSPTRPDGGYGATGTDVGPYFVSK